MVGGGFIGLEMVENLVHRGMKVTLLEKLGQVMPPADAEMTTPLVQELRRRGVDVHLNCCVTGFEQGEKDSIVVNTEGVGRVSNPSGQVGNLSYERGERFPADVVVLAIGVKPDVRLAKDAGLEIGATGGIRVDERTCAPTTRRFMPSATLLKLSISSPAAPRSSRWPGRPIARAGWPPTFYAAARSVSAAARARPSWGCSTSAWA